MVVYQHLLGFLASVCLLITRASGVTECSNPPPGVQKIFRGVDITTLDLAPIDFQGNSGFKNPVLNFSCNSGRNWRSPAGTVYQLPDQIWHMTSVPGGWLTADVNIYKTYNEVRRSMSSDVGGEGSLFKFSFSASQNYKKLQNTITNSSKYICDVSSFESATRVDVNPSWALELDRFAQIYIDRMLTGTFASNPIAYNRFINEFGTHYFSSANFGGFIWMLFETNTDYFYSQTEREIQRNAKASFLKIISLRGGTVTGSTTVDQRFESSTTQTVKYYGGDTNLLTQSGFQRWQPSVDLDPWLFSGQLKPISDLISDETKRTSMETAVRNYVLRSYLNELIRLIAAAKRKSDDAVLNRGNERVTTMLNKALLVESEVEDLGKFIEDQIIVPNWFSDNTNLCFKWRADGDAGQCGGGAANLLCAKPNSMTSVYRDDTDRRAGGCRMQWGLQSSGFPTWFNQVRVCYQWYADGDGGQCGGGDASLLCANINNFTPEYRDDTDRRNGGCRMQWKLEVPSSAPLWMRTSKMCFSWYPDGDGGQCGPAPSRDLCAVANQWTDYYRDDTDRRPGGCRMSWGVKLIF
ncbi:perivitellin-2 67 kDa subunit-like [Physella acuta]|uniref:perivitellin-2 67 kDa subunit-like n=1 Tax=Physella acuta TaxID=109671 RepID=UPI0027DB2BDE|nr:perivitellin-2 67 kDa subunit-like [Physella acuta]